MAVSIVATHIRADHRKPGLPGWGAVDFEWSDPPDANGVKRMERCPMHGVPAGVDLVTYAAQFIPDREAGRVRREIENNIIEISTKGSLASPTLNASIIADNIPPLREALKENIETQSIMIYDFFAAQSNTVLRNAFNKTQAEVLAFRASTLDQAVITAAAIRSSVGA